MCRRKKVPGKKEARQDLKGTRSGKKLKRPPKVMKRNNASFPSDEVEDAND